jgi:lysophospholipase L1-like esterase
MLKKLIFSVLTVSMFTYGVAVGHYKIFPFDQIVSIKSEILQPQPFSTSESYITNQHFFNEMIRDYDLVFLGDSITNAGRWAELFPDYNVANRGVGGDTSEGISKRLDTIIRSTPETVFLMFGINDISRGNSAEFVFDNYQYIIEALTKNNINVVIQSTLLSSRENWNIKVNKLNNKLVELSKDKGLVYINLNKTLAPTGTLESNVSLDGVHLHMDAYLQWKQMILESKSLL